VKANRWRREGGLMVKKLAASAGVPGVAENAKNYNSQKE